MLAGDLAARQDVVRAERDADLGHMAEVELVERLVGPKALGRVGGLEQRLEQRVAQCAGGRLAQPLDLVERVGGGVEQVAPIGFEDQQLAGDGHGAVLVVLALAVACRRRGDRQAGHAGGL